MSCFDLFIYLCFLACITQVGHRQPLPADRRPVAAAQLPRPLQAVRGLLPVQRGEPVAAVTDGVLPQWPSFFPPESLVSRRHQTGLLAYRAAAASWNALTSPPLISSFCRLCRLKTMSWLRAARWGGAVGLACRFVDSAFLILTVIFHLSPSSFLRSL